jgi:hypothetical protein
MRWLQETGRFLRLITTGHDNSSYDFIRVLTLAAGVTQMWNATVSTYAGHPFDAQGFGLGFAALVGAASLGVRVARPTEPGDEP